MSDEPTEIQKELISGLEHLVKNKYHVLGSTVVLIYDHLLTLERERRYIWQRKKSLPSYLFLFFRYTTLVVALLNLFALHDPSWSGSGCRRWIWLPVALGPMVSAAIGIIMIMRVHAIWARARTILYITVPVYFAELAVMVWAIPSGVPASFPTGSIGCIQSTNPESEFRLSALYLAALLFDVVIFLLTLSRWIHLYITHSTPFLVTLITTDGTMYFLFIVAANVATVWQIYLSPSSLTSIDAPFPTLISAVLVARLMLQLREAGEDERPDEDSIVSTGLTWRPSQTSEQSDIRFVEGDVQRRQDDPTQSNSRYTSFVEMMGLSEFEVMLGSSGTDRTERGTSASNSITDQGEIEVEGWEMARMSPRPGMLV